MVSTALLAAAISGIGGSVIGYAIAGYFNLKSTDRQIQAQEKQLEKRLAAQQEQLEQQLEAQQEQMDAQFEQQREQLKIQIASENERRRAEYYLEGKVDALVRVHSVLERTRGVYKRYADQAGYGGLSEEDYEEVIEWYENYRQAMDDASIFLDDDQYETLLDVYDVIHRTNPYLNRAVKNPDSVEYSEFDLAEYNNRFDEAEKMLKEEVKGPIDAISTEDDSSGSNK